MSLGARCTFVPPYLLEHIAASSSDAADTCRATLARDAALRAGRAAATAVPLPPAPATAGAAWVVHTADNTTTLPGRAVRSAGDAASGDQAVDEAATGVTDGFAAATITAASTVGAGEHVDLVRQAWSTVGVDPTGSSSPPAPAPVPAGQVLRVRRTGGIAGRTLDASLDLDDGSARAERARELLGRLDLTAPAPEEQAFPDAFSYTFEAAGGSVTVPQQALSADQRALADLVLSAD